MRKILSALSSTLQGGVRGGLLFFALLATIPLWAYDFQSGDLYYNITSDTTVEVTYQKFSSYNNYSTVTTISIPETVTYNGTTYSVTSIGERAFLYCRKLTSITIGINVTTIGINAFYNCPALTSIVVESGNSTYDSRENCNAIIETATNTLIAGCQNTAIPNSVTSIGDYAFYDCSSLTSVTIPNSVTSIGGYAFSGCDSLTSVTIPNSVTSIGDGAFNGCSSLTSITIPNSVTSIGGWAFSGCSSLTSITIPESVTSIGNNAFSGSTFVKENFVNNSVLGAEENNYWGASIVDTEIDGLLIRNDTVIDCRAYVTSVIIPNSVTSIGGYAFSYCPSLTSITIPNSVTSIGDGAFAGCIFAKENFVNHSVLDAEENNFWGASIVDTEIDGLLIRNDTVIDCRAYVTSVIIPNSVTSIGNSAFEYCTSLTSVTIPNSVTSIGGWAFWECESLKTVICEAIEIPELGDDVFDYMPLSEATLYVPAQSLDDYKVAEQWKEFGTILLIEEESEEEIELHDTDMTIVFTNSEDNDSEIYSQSLTIKVPAAPEIEGFTFLGWQPVATLITDTITIQAIYEADIPSSAPEVYVNPANPAQKLLRNGRVYILQDGKTYTITGQKL